MEAHRFQDKGTYLSQFMDAISVVCPKCQNHAFVTCKGYPQANNQPARIVCQHCGYNKERTDNSWVRVEDGQDPFFSLPLWFVEPVRGHVLWAYNREHLTFLKGVVSAEIRQKPPNQNRTLSNRLPKWMVKAKNRAVLLKAIERLENKTI